MKRDLISQVAQVAGYLWQRGWAERNGGNIVVRLDKMPDHMEHLNRDNDFGPFPTGVDVPHLVGVLFYCKGSGCRMRDLAESPFDNGSIIQICPDGRSYEIVSPQAIRPTSELTAHLAIHNRLMSTGSDMRATLHTHPTCLVALSHIDTLLEGDSLTHTLHSMIPEARLFCPKGIGIVPYLEPGTPALATATLKAIDNHELILWEKHGTLAIGTNIIEAFDTTDIMEKAADIYIKYRSII